MCDEEDCGVINPVAVVLLAVAVIAEAQQPKRIPRIGFIYFLFAFRCAAGIPGISARSSRSRIHRRKNLIVEYRYAKGKSIDSRISQLSLVRLRVDAIIVTEAPACSPSCQEGVHDGPYRQA